MLRASCIALVLVTASIAFAQPVKTGDEAVAKISPAKAAATQPSNKEVEGTVTFTQDNQDVHVTGDITGLSPGKHGIHIHEKPDMSDPQLKSAGPHFDMAGEHHHGGPGAADHHTGDLGNLTADDSGKAHLDEVMRNTMLTDLIGHSVIVHAGEDDMKTDPAGNSGGRVAGGEIVKK
jgi:superoxide dismutase, Cu-Zn family